jgi:hypothetical protein
VRVVEVQQHGTSWSRDVADLPTVALYSTSVVFLLGSANKSSIIGQLLDAMF